MFSHFEKTNIRFRIFVDAIISGLDRQSSKDLM